MSVTSSDELRALYEQEIDRFEWHTHLILEVLHTMRGEVAQLRASVTDAVRVSGSKAEAPAPANLGAIDAADQLWAVVIAFVREAAESISVDPPAAAAQVWVQGGYVAGFRSSVNADEASQLGYMVERWLNRHVLDIIRTPALAEPLGFVFAELRKARARWLPARELAPRRRVCTVCAERAVVVTYDDLDGVEHRRVDCRVCGAHYGHEPVQNDKETPDGN